MVSHLPPSGNDFTRRASLGFDWSRAPERTPVARLALGVLRAGFDAPSPPDPEATGPKAREDKKSLRWVEGLRDCARAARSLPGTRVVCTMDREADFLDLFVEHCEHAPQVELLVRAKVNRILGHDCTAEGDTAVRRLFDEVAVDERSPHQVRKLGDRSNPKTPATARVGTPSWW